MYNRAMHAYFLNWLSHVLRLVQPTLLWIVVEENAASFETAEMLTKTGVMYRHLVIQKNSSYVKDRGVHQRNLALEHIERHRLDGIVYFADDDNVYTIDFFDSLREIRLHVDISGFAFNTIILWDPKSWRRPIVKFNWQLNTVNEGFQVYSSSFLFVDIFLKIYEHWIVFCLEHRSYNQHQCSKAERHDVTVVICPICANGVRLRPDENPYITWDNHVNVDCDPSNYDKVTKKRKCLVYGFREILVFSNTIKCRDCTVDHCLKHRFGPEHCCPGPKKVDIGFAFMNLLNRCGEEEPKSKQSPATSSPKWSTLRGTMVVLQKLREVWLSKQLFVYLEMLL